MRKYQILFYIAALWNFSAAIVALSSQETHITMFYGSEYVTNDFIASIFLQAFWVTVLIFGIGYYMVARNPETNRGIIILAILGKSYVFCLWTYLFILGKAQWIAFIGGSGDLLFAILFAIFLCKTREQREVLEQVTA